MLNTDKIHMYVIGTAMLGLVAASSRLMAHDFWIIPDFTGGADALTVLGQSGTRFPTSDGPTQPARIAEALLVGAKGVARITDLAVAGKSLRLSTRPSESGEYLIGVTLQPRSVRADVAAFTKYLALEGAREEADRLQQSGLLAGHDSIGYRVSKYAKTILQFGSGGPAAFGRTIGHGLEFVPLTDPLITVAGGHLKIRLLANGKPVANTRVHAGAAADTDPDLHLLTDADGVFALPVSKSGLWNVRAAHVTPAGAAAEWRVDWATFVFEAGPAKALSSKTSSRPNADLATDSAEAITALERFHAALESGDSTVALSLLSPDAIILESGGIETRQEYATHHLPADIEFAKAVKSPRTVTNVVLRGGVAWITSTSVTQGLFKGRTLNSSGAELTVLSRESSGWQIRSIHWSSHTHRAP